MALVGGVLEAEFFPWLLFMTCRLPIYSPDSVLSSFITQCVMNGL
jgi:hypothetical protein